MLAGSGKFDWSRTVVTASTPLLITEADREAVAAVVGLQMTYNKFYEYFVNATRLCPPEFATSSGSAASACNLTCASPVTTAGRAPSHVSPSLAFLALTKWREDYFGAYINVGAN